MAFIALYDANVIYPASLRDLLVRLGQSRLFQAKWTDQILDEAFAAIVRDQPELADKLGRTRELMNNAIADAQVTGYESLIEGLELPDAADRHVLAAAIVCNAQVIVTANLRHFPDESLALIIHESVGRCGVGPRKSPSDLRRCMRSKYASVSSRGASPR